MQTVREVRNITAETFRDELVVGHRPAVFRGLVGNWPMVAAARESDEEFCRYIKQFDRGYGIHTAFGPPSIGGRFFYNEDLSGLNCRMTESKLAQSLDYLLEHRDDRPAPALAIQSVVISRYLPGLEAANRLPAGFVPAGIEPRLWLGNRGTVAAHYDPSENLACAVAGRRRFTLFPPEQVENLYIGPFELTPAGAVISMVDFDHPDYERYPRFRDAEAAALVVDLEPGDAIYIPYLWWHHVRSLDAVNGLVNFWWAREPERCGDPRNVLMHAIAAIGHLPPAYRDAWRAMFDHYVFDPEDRAGQHLPPDRRGILGEPDAQTIARFRAGLAKALSRVRG